MTPEPALSYAETKLLGEYQPLFDLIGQPPVGTHLDLLDAYLRLIALGMIYRAGGRVAVNTPRVALVRLACEMVRATPKGADGARPD